MDEFVQWLTAQLDADAARATEAADNDSGEWFMGDKWNVYRAEDEAPDEDMETNTLVVYGNVKSQSEHIAEHDPARVLREIEAKRGIVAAYLPPGEDPHPGQPCINYDGQDPDEYDDYDSCFRHLEANKRLLRHDYVLRLLASAYEGRPGYQEAWRP